MFFTYGDPALRYTGRWGKEEGRVTATAPGAYFEFAFRGDLAVLRFDLSLQTAPYPHLWISVDDGPRVESTLSPFVRISAPDGGTHRVRVIFKGGMEMQHRWHQPLVGRVSLTGIEAEELSELPADTRKTIEFVGDSITEGVLIDESCRFFLEECTNRPFQDDVCATYAWLTAEALDLRPYMMGYGAVGTTKGGCGGVPSVVESYPYNFEQSPVCYGEPDYILINHGTNDMHATAEHYCKKYRELLDVIRSAHPRSQIISLAVFYGVHPKELEALIREYNQEHGTEIAFVDASGWVPREPVHPLRDGHKLIARRLSEELKKIIR